jgi:hypothetical protein
MEIMSLPVPRLLRIPALVCCLVFPLASASFGGDLVLQKVPPLTVDQAPAYPQNLARYELGAEIKPLPPTSANGTFQLSVNSDDTNASEAALLCDDPTIGYPLPKGSTTLLISLSRIENINKICFLNSGARGEVTVATSSAKLPGEGTQWHKVLQQELASNVVNANVGPNEAKYLKLTFNITQAGRIARLGVYSTPAISDFTMPRARRVLPNQSESLTSVSYNLSDVHTKARALYVSSGTDLAEANNMIDDQPGTTYSFSVEDAGPTVVIDLAKETSVRRISSTYSPRRAMVDFYVLNTLPGVPPDHGAIPATLHLNDATLAGLKSVGSVADVGKGRSAIDFPPVTGRYIVVRWSRMPHEDAAFAVDEIAVFSGNASRTLIAANTALSYDGKEAKDFGEGKDAKEMPEEAPPAEGPAQTLPDPPPFVFVPEIIPTSP